MNKILISAKKDFLESLAAAPPIKALAELVWNGLDAGSDRVEVNLEMNVIDGLERIRVRDYGHGIDHADVKSLFGNLGESWKRAKSRHNGRALHGKNGQGRFKAFGLGNRVEWVTVFLKDGKRMRYQISGRSNALDAIQFSDPVAANGDLSGTEVVVTEIEKSHGTLLSDTAPEELARLFAAYLSQYPEVDIKYNGVRLDPAGLQDCKKDLFLDDIDLGNGKTAKAVVTIIEWKVPTKRGIHLCDSSGVSLHDTDIGAQIRAPGFTFTAYVKCDHFRELDKENLLILDDLHAEVSTILKPAKEVIKSYFRRRLAERQGGIVQRWKEQHIYPYEDKDYIEPVEEAERQVFDIVAVNVEAYLPSFALADTRSRKFMFRLLAQALRQNPESVQQIVTEVLNLKKEEQEDLAQLLSKTPLSAIISSAKIVANRLDFLLALENLLFDRETKKRLLERDQLHKILETEAWLFHEEFALAGSEQRLEEVLELHLATLGVREDDPDPVLMEGGKQGRIDLLLSRVTQPRHGEHDYLVIELKRPSQKINSTILGQIESYAIAVASESRFSGQKGRWTFIVVGNEMDEHAKRKAKQRERPRGLVFDDSDLNITVWAKTWSEIITDARSRLIFVNAQLSYDATRETSTAYLRKTHAKFIPDQSSEEPDDKPDCDEPDEG